MKFALSILVATVVLLLVGVLPAGQGTADSVYRSPVFIAMLGLVALSSLAGCIALMHRCWKARRMFGLRQIGFLLTHVSVAVILAGAFLRFIYGQEGSFLLPVTVRHSVSASYDGKINLSFGVSAADLEILYYEPTHYDLFVMIGDTNEMNAAHEFSRKVVIHSDGPLFVDSNTKMEQSEMRDDGGNWVPFHYLEDGSILQISRVVRSYSAMLHFEGADGAVIDEKIAVNHPVTYRKWRFYLMSAKEGQPYIVLTGKNDPGWPFVRSGIWMMMVGVAIMCFRKTGVD